MPKNLLEIIEQVSREKGIDREVFFKAIEDAIKTAAKIYFKENEPVNIDFDWKEGDIKIFTKKVVVKKVKDEAKEVSWEQAKKTNPDVKLGDTIEINLPAEILGRISAQVAKNIIYNEIYTAERDKVYKEFAPKIGTIITGKVRRFLGNDAVLSVGKAEALLPKKEQLKTDNIKRGMELKALIRKVYKEGKDPQIILTRKSKSFLIKLLEFEIPEIADGTIELKSVVREPGEKSKIAVYTKEKNIDPIGACIGMRGNRILAVTRELSGERIDVVIWSENPEIFIKNAMAPAKISRIKILSEEERKAIVYVPKEQLAIAIGKQGVNVKLASKLTGWHIDLQRED